MTDPCCNIPEMDKLPAAEEQSRQVTAYFQIQGMNCRNCVNRVRNGLLSTYGVSAVIIEQFEGLAEVVYNPDLTKTEELIQAVQSAGGDGVHEYSARVLNL